MSQLIEFDKVRNAASLGGASMVLHCHFYNCTLQRAVEQGLGAGAHDVLRDAAVTTVRGQLQKVAPPGAPRSEVLSIASRLFSELGFGRFAPFALDSTGGEVIVTSSHYAMGWLSIYGDRSEPACRFVEGFLQAAVEAAFGRTSGVTVEEHRCFACGHDDCRFRVEVKP